MFEMLIGGVIMAIGILIGILAKPGKPIDVGPANVYDRIAARGQQIAKLSARIYRQRRIIRKMQEGLPKPRRTREEWEAYKAAAKTSTSRPNLPH